MNILWVVSMDIDHSYFHGIKSHPNGVYRHVSYNIWEPADGKHPLWSLDICVLLQKCFNGRAKQGPSNSASQMINRWFLLLLTSASCRATERISKPHTGRMAVACLETNPWGQNLFWRLPLLSGGLRRSDATPCWASMSRKGWDEIMRQLMHLLTIEGNTK